MGFDGTRPATLTMYRVIAERYVKPVLGGVRLDKLTPAHVQHLVKETRNSETTRGTPPSASTLRHVYKLLRNAMGDAYRMELVTRNVATQVKAPPVPRQRRPDLSVADAKRLLKVIAGERLEALYVLALTTGLRRGELLALRWDGIDFDSRQLRVRHALQRVDGKLRSVEPKISSSRRSVVLPKIAVRYLEEHRNRQDNERLELWAPGENMDSSSPRLSERRSSRGMSTGAGTSCGPGLAWTGSVCTTCGTDARRSSWLRVSRPAPS